MSFNSSWQDRDLLPSCFKTHYFLQKEQPQSFAINAWLENYNAAHTSGNKKLRESHYWFAYNLKHYHIKKCRLTWVLRRYDMSSNSPSGGIKEIVLSFSKRERRTHWWNFTSSSSTDLLLPPSRKYTFQGATQVKTRVSSEQRSWLLTSLPFSQHLL